jgi:hypothetical protein
MHQFHRSNKKASRHVESFVQPAGAFRHQMTAFLLLKKAIEQLARNPKKPKQHMLFPIPLRGPGKYK